MKTIIATLTKSVTTRLGLAAVTGLLALPTSQAQNAKTWSEVPFDEVLENTCTGEFVKFTGSVWSIFKESSDGSGGYRFEYQFRAKIDGVGLTSGRKYAIYDSAHQTGHVNQTGDVTEGNLVLTLTFTQNWKLISQGSADNGALRQTVHLTFNAAGDLTASVDNELVDMCVN